MKSQDPYFIRSECGCLKLTATHKVSAPPVQVIYFNFGLIRFTSVIALFLESCTDGVEVTSKLIAERLAIDCTLLLIRLTTHCSLWLSSVSVEEKFYRCTFFFLLLFIQKVISEVTERIPVIVSHNIRSGCNLVMYTPES